MVLLEKLWEDMSAGPRPHRGLGKLRKVSTKPLATRDVEGVRESSGSKLQGSLSMPATPVSPATPLTPTGLATVLNGDVWRTVFNPGSNIATNSTGGGFVSEKTQSNSPAFYDWLYSAETRSTPTTAAEWNHLGCMGHLIDDEF